MEVVSQASHEYIARQKKGANYFLFCIMTRHSIMNVLKPTKCTQNRAKIKFLFAYSNI